jgi:hypothetical protein
MGEVDSVALEGISGLLLIPLLPLQLFFSLLLLLLQSASREGCPLRRYLAHRAKPGK